MKTLRNTLAVVAILALAIFGMNGVGAQTTGTPTPSPTLPATPAEQAATVVASLNYPVAVHEGTCQMPTAQPVFELGNAVPVGDGNDDAETVGTSATSAVLTTTGTIDGELSDIAEQGHVIAVHASPEDYGTILACGGIAGTVVDGKLIIAIQPVGESSMSGIAIVDGGDVTIYLTSQSSDGSFPTPATTPTPLS